jgi:magnesium transporter
MPLEELDAIFRDISAEDLIELSESLPQELVDRAFLAMDEVQQRYFTGAQQFDEDQVGHWVDHDLVVLPPNAKVKDAFRILRRGTPEYTDLIYLVSRSGHLSGTIELKVIFGEPDNTHLSDLVDKEIEPIKGTEDSVDAAKAVQMSGFSALPVVDENQVLLGRLNIKTASEIIAEDYEAQLMASAGIKKF